jgi:hypothetical protein
MLSANPETISTGLSLRESDKELGSIAGRQIRQGTSGTARCDLPDITILAKKYGILLKTRL